MKRTENSQASMPLLKHLEELRRRLAITIAALVIGVVIGTFFTTPVLKMLIAPLDDQIPQALKPTEPIAVYFKIATVIGVGVAMPVILYQTYQFVRPGLEPHERRYVTTGVLFASLSFVAGMAFAAKVLLPAAIPFLKNFMSETIEHKYSISEYTSLVANTLLWAGLVFETPLVMFFLAKLGVVTPQGFAKARGGVIVGAAAGAAIITPTTDPVNMLLVMVPFVALYEFGILLARLARPKRRRATT